MFREYIEDKQQEVAFHVMQRAAIEVCISKHSCRGVETDNDIKSTTLIRYCTMKQAKLDGGEDINI